MSKIVYSHSFLEFIKRSDCKIAEILFKVHCKYQWRPNYQSLIVTDSEVNYITFRNDGTISFLPNGKEHKSANGEWSRDGRQNAKPAKVIRKLFTARIQKYFKDSDFECFTNEYKASFSDKGYRMELLPNTEIANVYNMSNRCEGEGSLNNSCMNGDGDYLDIYTHCNQLQILVLKNKDSQLCGRALVWKISDDITLMDRIYVAQDFMFEMFLTYAKDHKFWRKEYYKSYDCKTSFIDPLGNRVNKEITIETDTDFRRYPYIDTFAYGMDGSLNNFSDGYYIYKNTDGTRHGENNEYDEDEDHDGQRYDEINEEWIDEDDAVYIDRGEYRYRGRYCHIDNCVCVDDEYYYEDDDSIIQINGTWYRTDDEEIIEIDGDYHLRDECIYLDYKDEYALESDCVYSEKDEQDYLLDDCVYSEIYDSYILKEDSVHSDIHEDWILKDEAIAVNDDDDNESNCYHKDYIYSDIHNEYVKKEDSILVCGCIHLRSDFNSQGNLFAA